jgi:hypothetical protein
MTNTEIEIGPFTLNFPKDSEHIRFTFEKSNKEYLISFDAIEKLVAQYAFTKQEKSEQ